MGEGGPACDKKWNQWDLRFCKNEDSKISNNNEKGVHKIENQGEKWYKLLQKCQLTEFGEKNRPTLGKIISGTKCYRDKQIFSVEIGDHKENK